MTIRAPLSSAACRMTAPPVPMTAPAVSCGTSSRSSSAVPVLREGKPLPRSLINRFFGCGVHIKAGGGLWDIRADVVAGASTRGISADPRPVVEGNFISKV